MLFGGAVANFNIAQTMFSSAFGVVWMNPYRGAGLRLSVLCEL
jgi:hypothetical protein